MSTKTIEQKARAYDEAKERMRAFLKEWENCGAYGEAMEKARSVFPELKESEDERIRKWLYDYINNCPNNNFAFYGGVGKDAVLNYLEKRKYDRMQPVYDNLDSFESALAKAWKAYNDTGARTVDGCEDDYVECAHAKGFREGYLFGLEKQKEQKPEWKPQPESLEALMYAIEGKWDMISPTSYLSLRLEDLYEGLVNTFNVDESLLAELPKVASSAYTAEDIEELRELKRKIETSMEQEPAEWSDGKSILEDIIVFVSGYADKRVVAKWVSFLKSLRPQLKYEWSEEERKILDSIIDDYEKAARSFCGYDGKIGLLRAIRDGEYNLPKPAWSEEDEEVMEDLYNFVTSDYIQDHIHETRWKPWKITLERNRQNRLKSLRNRGTNCTLLWKPSEEQMKALEDAFRKDGSDEYRKTINSLYQDLKKLM